MTKAQDRRWRPRAVWLWLVESPVQTQLALRRQARLLSTVLVSLIALGLAAGILPKIIAPRGPILEDTGFWATIALAGILTTAYALNRTGRYTPAAILTIAMICLGIFADVISASDLGNIDSLFYLILPILLASILLSQRAALGLVTINVVCILLLPLVMPGLHRSVLVAPLTFVIILSAMILLTTEHRNLLEQDRQAQLNAILRAIPVGISVQSPGGGLTYANDEAARLVGFPSGESFVQAPLAGILDSFLVMDELGQPLPLTQLPGRLALHNAQTSEAVLRFRVRPHGDERVSLVRATPVFDDLGSVQLVVNAFQDITTLKMTENAQRFLAEASAILSSSLDYQTTLSNVARLAVPTIADWCAVDLLEDGENLKRVVTAHQDPTKVALADEIQKRYPEDPKAPGGVRQVIQTGKSLFYPEIPDAMVVAAARDEEHLRLLREIGFRAGMVVPLIVGGRTLGALTLVASEVKQRFQQADLYLAEELARRAALAVDNARLYREVQRQREHLHVTLSSIGDAVIVTDTAGRVTFMNPIAQALTGWPQADAHGREITEIFHIVNETSRQEVANPVSRVLREGMVVGLANHTILIAKHGAEIPIDDSGAPIKDDQGTLIGTVLVFRDIAERRKVEKTQRFLTEVSSMLSASLNTRQTLEELAQLVVPTIADWCNIRMIAENGRDLELIVVRHLDPEKVGLARQMFDKMALSLDSTHPVIDVMKTGKASFAPEVPDDYIDTVTPDPKLRDILRSLTLKSGLYVPLVARGRTLGLMTLHIAESERRFGPDDLAMADDLGRRAGLAIDNARLYEQSQANAEVLQQRVAERTADLEEALVRAQGADKAKSNLLSTVSHEMRTPLSSIIGFSNLILRRNPGPEKLKDYISFINSEARRLSDLINDFLDLQRLEAKREVFRFTELDLAALLEDVARQQQLAEQSLHPIRLEVSQVAPVYADSNRIRQVILNLLSNAVKYSPGGGEITLLLRQVGDEVICSVRDQGIGISAEELAHLFERFYRGDIAERQRIRGTGLGLALSREIIQAHRGRIWVESAGPKQGSTFSFALPVLEAIQPTPRPAQRNSEERLILIVEDDRSFAAYLTERLQPEGYLVRVLTFAQATIDAIATLVPSLIILDILDGEEQLGWPLLAQLKQQPSMQDIPVLMCSVLDDTGKAWQLGASSYVVKPVDEGYLLHEVSRLIGTPPHTVLVVDDDPALRIMLNALLAEAGYQVQMAENGQVAIDLLRQTSPDLVILDLLMPNVDGFSVLEWVRVNQRNFTLPIIAFTAAELDAVQQQMVRNWASSLSVKSNTSTPDLLDSVKSLLGR
jgi:PAS domain S-box-containing protein